tara:strand:- start:1912 stop:2796 length:885 start_codon:yes stop_codon:yes gene_type:complete
MPIMNQGSNIGGSAEIPIGITGSEQALAGGLEGGIAALRQGANRGRADVQKGIQAFDPFAQTGTGAAGLQGALSGAMGPQAQAQAFQDFQSSPGQQFLQQRGEQALLRNRGAIGGLGGGNVQKALTEFGIGTAAQDFGNQFNRLGQVAGQGLQAIGSQGQLRGQQANIANQLGQNAGSMIGNTGQLLSQGRMQTGRDLANIISGGTQNLAEIQAGQGQGVSNLLGVSGGNLANLLGGQGTQSGNIAMGLGQGLANVRQTASGQFGGLPIAPGAQNMQGGLQGVGKAISGIAGFI